MIQVAICDDHQLFREGIRFLLDQMTDVDLLYEAANGEELMKKLEEEQPNVLLLDLEMPDLDGVETLKRIRPLYPDLGVIILTTYSDTKMVAYLMELGANSYLLKDCDAETLQRGIQSVYHEGYYFTREVSKAMLGGLKGNARKKPELKNNVKISERELEVLELICQEYTTREIAEKLFISHRTAEGHRKNLIEKLGVKNTAGLIVKAIKEGVIEI
ncbi:response regulator transcription factor [Roseivirga sp. E12]|uniref:response regulator transcription factor n=1 Tax=Roseivirga sp. E12 TaxID=2819237 RepID=UPI001ABC3542|nr:response regulator transcription factor [Roseivirga sp. E12]MBO3698068.1 response regulator transcription factor [Roseivirga sp. E12]